MNGYKAFYNGKEIEVQADSSYHAQLTAMVVLKVPPKKRHMITVVLCERADGSQVVHSPTELP